MNPSRRSILGLLLLVSSIFAASQWWAARQQSALGQQLAALARPGDIRMLSSTTCPYCKAARRWMDEHSVAYSECFIEEDAACAAAFQAARAPGTPVLLVRGKPMLGFDPQRVRDRLAAGG